MRLLVVCCSPNLWLKLGDLGVSLAVVKNVTARWSLVAWLVLIAVSTMPIAIRTGSEVVGKIITNDNYNQCGVLLHEKFVVETLTAPDYSFLAVFELHR